VGAAALPIVLLGAVQGHQHGQGPRPAGAGQPDQHGQDDPLVPPAPGGVAVAAADGVAVLRLAVDLPAGGFGGRGVGHQGDDARGPVAAQHGAGQQGGQAQAGPARLGEDAVVAGRGAPAEVANGPQQVGDGAAAGGEDTGDGEQLGAGEDGAGEGGLEEGEDGQGAAGYAGQGASWRGYRPWPPNRHDTAPETPPLAHAHSAATRPPSANNGHYGSLQKSS